jgi:hypothetical protein
MPRSSARLVALILPLVALALLTACGSSGGGEPASGDSVAVATVEPKPAATQTGGKAANPPAAATGQPVSQTTQGSRPTTGRWIDVDVTRYQVQLMDGDKVVQTIGPVAVGAQVNTGVYESTQTGLFHVYIKTEALAFDAPYNTYISHWVGFDAEKANGFHSFLKDATGKVVDAGTGRISNGCIRTGAPEAIFAYAEIGMPVFVHL